jgi:hypothetical protein
MRKELRRVLLTRGRLFKRPRVLSDSCIMNRFNRGSNSEEFKRKTLEIAIKTRFFLAFKRVSS